MDENPRVRPNFAGPYLNNRLRFFDSVKSSWTPMSRATKYVEIFKFFGRPPPVPLMLTAFMERL